MQRLHRTRTCSPTSLARCASPTPVARNCTITHQCGTVRPACWVPACQPCHDAMLHIARLQELFPRRIPCPLRYSTAPVELRKLSLWPTDGRRKSHRVRDWLCSSPSLVLWRMTTISLARFSSKRLIRFAPDAWTSHLGAALSLASLPLVPTIATVPSCAAFHASSCLGKPPSAWLPTHFHHLFYPHGDDRAAISSSDSSLDCPYPSIPMSQPAPQEFAWRCQQQWCDSTQQRNLMDVP